MESIEGSVQMIRYSVRFSVPWFILAFIASAASYLFRDSFSNWLMTNRKHLGVAFGFGMGWQLLFIALMSFRHSEYFFSEILQEFQYFELGVYVILGLMVVTSFRYWSSKLKPKAWKQLHTTGMYLLWFVITGSYILYSVTRPSLFNYLMALVCLSALGLRLLAATRRRVVTGNTSAV